MSKRMKHSKTVKIRFTNPEYQAVKITAYKKGYSVPELLRVLCTIAGAESDPLLNPGTIKIIQNHTHSVKYGITFNSGRFQKM